MILEKVSIIFPILLNPVQEFLEDKDMESQKLKLCTNRKKIIVPIFVRWRAMYICTHLCIVFDSVFPLLFLDLTVYDVTSQAAYSIEFVSRGIEKSHRKFMEIRNIQKFMNSKFKMKMHICLTTLQNGIVCYIRVLIPYFILNLVLQVRCGKCGNGLGHEFLKDGPGGKTSRF